MPEYNYYRPKLDEKAALAKAQQLLSSGKDYLIDGISFAAKSVPEQGQQYIRVMQVRVRNDAEYGQASVLYRIVEDKLEQVDLQEGEDNYA